MKLTKIGEFLKRSKIPVDILDDEHYNRVTIRINHNGVSLRDNEIGKEIGTKKQFILKSGQFILSKIDARYGAFGIAPQEVEGSIITGNFWAYDVDKKKVNIEWFNQFTNSPVFYEVCERASSGITHRKYLDEKFFLNYEILLPSVEEQLTQIEKIKKQKISFGELSTELTHQLDLVKKLRQQLLQDAVQGKLVPQNPNDEPAGELLKKIKAEKQKLIALGKLKKEKKLLPIKAEEIPFEIPEGWVWCRLGEVTLYSEAGTSYQAEGVNAQENEWAVIKTSAITSGCFLESENKKLPNQNDNFSKIKIEIGDLLFCRASGSKGLAGKSCLVETKMKSKLILSDKSIRYHFSNTISKKFIHLYNSSLFGEAYYQNIGTKKSTTMNNITREQFNNLPIPIPTKSEQHRIVQKLDELMQTCDALEASIKESAAQNEKLLQQVLREALRKEDRKKGQLSNLR